MRRAEPAAELLDASFRPPAPEDGVPEPGEFIHHRAAQAARHPCDQNNLLSHNLF